MDLAQRIQAKTDNGDTIIDFLIEVMTDQLDHFKMNHRLQAARLLTKYGCSCRKSDSAQRDEGIAFILNNLPEPSQDPSATGSSDNTEFDQALARKIREATDDGATVCRFLINVMEGQLKAFKPHHRIAAARELLSRGFGKHAGQASSLNNIPPLPQGEGWGEGEKTEGRSTPSHTSQPTTDPTKSDKSPNPTNQSSDNLTTNPEDEEEIPYDEIYALIDAAKEESDRILREQGIDPDNPPYKTDYSVFDEAADNSHKWFLEWKHSLDPDEYHAIVKEGAERFSAEIDRRVERRKQIKKEREQREKEAAELEVSAGQSQGRSQREGRGRPVRCQKSWKTSAHPHPVKNTNAGHPHPASRPHSGWSTAVTPSASCTTDQSTTPRTTRTVPTTGTAAHQ